jgi:DNA-binding SARP family transcriptional activator
MWQTGPSAVGGYWCVIRVSLSGAFGLNTNGESIDVSVPAQRLLAFLALRDHAVDRSHVAAVLWRSASPERAAGSLRSALWRIRRCGDFLVEMTSRGLRLSPAVWVDVPCRTGKTTGS